MLENVYDTLITPGLVSKSVVCIFINVPALTNTIDHDALSSRLSHKMAAMHIERC